MKKAIVSKLKNLMGNLHSLKIDDCTSNDDCNGGSCIHAQDDWFQTVRNYVGPIDTLNDDICYCRGSAGPTCSHKVPNFTGKGLQIKTKRNFLNVFEILF